MGLIALCTISILTWSGNNSFPLPAAIPGDFTPCLMLSGAAPSDKQGKLMALEPILLSKQIFLRIWITSGKSFEKLARFIHDV